MDCLEETLLKIAKLFNGLKIKWNVGGSVMLAHYGLHENPHDIDIIAAKEDVQKARAALESLGTQKKVPESKVFVSDCYYKFDIGGVEVDLISGYKIKHSEGVYEHRPEFCKKEGGCSGEVFYASLEKWLALYLMMPGGSEKALKIEKHLKKSADIDKEKLNRIYKMCLPKHAAYKISELINKA